jgi:hypothetical protein
MDLDEKMQEISSSWRACVYITFHTYCLLTAFMDYMIRVVSQSLLSVSYTCMENWTNLLWLYMRTCPFPYSIRSSPAVRVNGRTKYCFVLYLYYLQSEVWNREWDMESARDRSPKTFLLLQELRLPENWLITPATLLGVLLGYIN